MIYVSAAGSMWNEKKEMRVNDVLQCFQFSDWNLFWEKGVCDEWVCLFVWSPALAAYPCLSTSFIIKKKTKTNNSPPPPLLIEADAITSKLSSHTIGLYVN